ncbi:MAG: ATP-dependent DNA helicase RecG [Myxococcaceae bacterium]
MSDPYQDPIGKLTGIGPAREKAFNNLGVHTVKDLLGILPRTYQLREKHLISSLKPGMQALVVGTIMRMQTVGPPKSQRLEIMFKDGTAYLKLVFFQLRPVAYLQALAPQTELTVMGSITSFNSMLQMTHPKVALGDKTQEMHGVWPIYPELKNLGPSDLTKAIESALGYVRKSCTESLPAEFLKQHNLLSLLESYELIHRPEDLITDTDHHPAFRRLAFEELYQLQVRLAKHRQIQQQSKAPVVSPVSAEILFKKILPFTPTKAQIRVINEILSDLSQPHPMLRLLQGDVGAGKTAVAASAAYHMSGSNYQTALMAPTEILAEQHYQLFTKLFGSSLVARLQGSLGAKERREVLRRLKTGEAKIAIGTHALISEDVEFSNLGLCIIDEQHRFGVNQRTELRNKGKRGLQVPHVLAMTATPIPRSLALTAYGDFSLSVLDELPPGRTPISTHILQGDPTQNMLMLADKCLRSSEQAYIIYPLVEESEKIDLLDAQQGFSGLEGRFGSEKVALIHGRMTAAEKDAAMQRFMLGQAQLLVSTTVIEVGVDVPNASCMMIIHPERFGLSQLHQLRGRVGRGSKKSACYLLTNQLFPSEETYRRLAIMEKSQNGFEIAAEDLKIRGPGDFLGTRQAGLPIFHHCDLVKHADLIEPARELAITSSAR